MRPLVKFIIIRIFVNLPQFNTEDRLGRCQKFDFRRREGTQFLYCKFTFKKKNFGGLAGELNNRIPEARELTFWFNLLIQSCCRFGSQIMQTRFDIPTQIRSGRRACPSWRNGSFDSPNGMAIEEKKRTVSILKLRNHENVSFWPSLNLPRLH